jgi:hypothetical protein
MVCIPFHYLSFCCSQQQINMDNTLKINKGVSAFYGSDDKIRYIQFEHSKIYHSCTKDQLLNLKSYFDPIYCYDSDHDILIIALLSPSSQEKIGLSGHSWNKQDLSEMFIFDMYAMESVYGLTVLDASLHIVINK